MKEVFITFSNIQSHELTAFTLKPGMNFILADDNNVGKSTIFRLLSTMASYPQVSGYKVNRLIRKGCSQAYAAFKFDGSSVICWLARGNTDGSAKMFFEHIDEHGAGTRSSVCPKDLLDALGIVRDSSGLAMNFNDADSVQLVSENTVEGDNIITQVMTDERVTTMRVNMASLVRDLQLDEKHIAGKATAGEDLLGHLEFTPGLEYIGDEIEALEPLCRVLDYNLVKLGDDVDNSLYVEARRLDVVVGLLETLKPVCEWKEDVEGVSDLFRIMGILEKMTPMSDRLCDVDTVWCEDRYSVVEKLMTCISTTYTGYRALERMDNLDASERKAKERLALLNQQLEKVSKVIECPVKGRVYYSDEKCIPVVD